MKPILGVLLFVLFTAFMPARNIKSNNVTLQTADSCRRVALVNQKYWPDPAVFTVKFCDSTIQEYTLLPGQYVELPCVSISYGVVITQGQLTVDWMAGCQ